MSAHRRFLHVVLAVGALAAAAGCDRARTRGPSGVTTTTAENIRPDRRPPPARTVDAAGFMDNGGRSSNETVRTELSGMRAAESGTHAPTGTPGSGLPLPIEPGTRGAESGERPRPPELGRNAPAGAPTVTVTERVAQALCDHENVCGRVGSKDAPTLATCMSRIRLGVQDDLAQAGCPNGHDPNEVADCLSAIRLASCDRRVDSLGALPECDARSLCLQR